MAQTNTTPDFPKDKLYTVLPRAMVEAIHDFIPARVEALRLMYGILLYGADRGLSAMETCYSIEERFCERPIQSIPCKDIADLVATKGANDHRWIKRGAEQLHATTSVFVAVDIDGSKSLRPRLKCLYHSENELSEGERCYDESEFEDGYAVVTADDLRHGSPYRIMANVLTALERNKNFPKFRLPKIAVGSLQHQIDHFVTPTRRTEDQIGADHGEHFRFSDPNDSNEEFAEWIKRQRELLGVQEWHEVAARWLNAFKAISAQEGLRFLVMPVEADLSPVVERVEVKIQHENTQWSDGTLYKGPATVRDIYEITPNGVTRLKRDKWKAKVHQTKIA